MHNLYPCGEDIDVDPIVGLIVADGTFGRTVRLKTGLGQVLESLLQRIDVRPPGFIFRHPGNNFRGGAVLEVKGVD